MEKNKNFEEIRNLQTEVLKATATLNNLQWCVFNGMEDVDVISSLDVLKDQMKTILDTVDFLYSGGAVHE